MPAPPSIDIFCRVVDNYGDIGVCWRLARQLAARNDCGRVRLWVDDLASFSRIAPAVLSTPAVQEVSQVTVVRWDTAGPQDPGLLEPADMVIEAFACSPPAAYIGNMSARQLWLNLEYLSAEDWVESCHGLPSMQANGLRKFFFFPGFTERTGGLLREPGLISRRNAWQADTEARLGLLGDLGVDPRWLQRLREGATLVYLFCYPQAPVLSLYRSLVQQGRDTLILMARGVFPLASPDHQTGMAQVAVHEHDFVDQDVFDRLLWSSDLNIVRGEDSLVRAIWAGRPLIWQPYLQQDGAHLDKLDAWLARTAYPEEIRQAIQAWNRCDTANLALSLESLLRRDGLDCWQRYARDWSEQLAQQQDLAGRLLTFYAEHSKTR